MGLLYAVGAVFNMVYTLRHGREFYGSFVASAWNPPARWFLRTFVLPRARLFTVALIVFQVGVAVLIFTRGELVRPALGAGAAFAALAAAVSSPAGAAANLALAGIQLALALAR